MGVINLDIFVSDIASALLSFDVIQVERSVAGDTGPWSPLTKLAPAAPATLLSSLSSPYIGVGGTTLQLIRDSQAQANIVLSGVGNRTVDQVAVDINAAVGVTIAVDELGKLRLTSTLLGTQSKLEVVGGSAAVPLGFTAGQRDIGEEPYVALVVGVTNYAFSDKDGEASYFYRVRFYNTATGLLSAYSAPFQGSPGTLISAGNLSVGSVDLVDAQGMALADQVISFYPVHQPLQVEGFQVALNRKPVSVTTDNAGHAEVSLVRGLRVRVVVESTSLIRDITVPNAATFDVMALVASAPDIYNIAVPNLPAALRRSI